MLWPRRCQMNALNLPVRILIGESPNRDAQANNRLSSRLWRPKLALFRRSVLKSYGYLGESGLGTRTKSLV